MNHIYRSIWNASTGTVTAVSEHAKSRGKKTSGSKSAVVRAVSAALALSCGAAGASPTGGTVVAGNASISSASGTTTIQQSTQNAALTWQSFDVGVTESVRFVQPNSNSVALNRVLGSDPSTILGSLSSNGKVFLVNPNGILFGTGAQVNVGGLVASTRNITDSDFMAGRYEFNGSSAGSIVNNGSIHADGGYVALLGANVSNQGVIAARLGTVALAAGSAFTLDVAGDGLLNVAVNAGAVDALVHNGGLIKADGGQVLLTARSAGSLLQSAVNNTGVIQAQTIENRNGMIRLLGDMDSGTVSVGGTLDASAPTGGDGGFIDTSAAHVNVANDARVTTAAARGLTGSWLIDPTDYTIAASGGDITGAQLSSNLASTNVIIQSIAGATDAAGDVNVNDTVTWSANRLTLNAQNNININTAMNASGTASLALEYGQGALAAGNTSKVNVNAPVNLPAGNNFSTLQGSNGSVVNYTVINSVGASNSVTGTDLQGIGGNLTRNYVLGADIDAAVTSTWNAGAGFTPIGTDPSRFTGIFDGLGHTVSGIYINRTGSQFTGLFGYTAPGSMIRNVGSIGGSVTSDSWGTGALVGSLLGTVMNSYATGSVRGFQTVGGLVGAIGDFGAIVASHATGDVVAYGSNGEAGGLVGLVWGTPRGTVTDSYATGNVSSPAGNVGGLIGINWGTVTNSYAAGTASGTDYIGGLIGDNSQGTFSNSYATGAVSGTNNVGGLAGGNSNSITNSYATGAVTGSVSVGGAVGRNYGTLSNSYATGNVSGGFVTGGLIGTNRGAVSYSHATGTVMGGDQTAGLVGGNQSGSISYSYATGDVTASTGASGGLVGYSSAPISNSYATGAVSGVSGVGGILGAMNGSSVTNSYATGAVTGTSHVGGVVGNSTNGTIANTYSSGLVTGTTNVGGMLGSNVNATVTNSYWDLTTSGQAMSAGGVGLTTVQMQTASNFTGFNFTTTPGATGNNWVMVNLDGGLNGGVGATRPMLASEYSTTITNAHQLQLAIMNLGASYTLGRDIDAAATATANDVWLGSTFIELAALNSLSQGVQFTGSFDGLGHAIANLNINRPGEGYIGLFGFVASAGSVRSVGLVGGSVTGSENVGQLVGRNEGTVINSYATGTVQGDVNVGGLIGTNRGAVSDSYANAAVHGNQYVGGLVGFNDDGAITDSHAGGAVSGGNYVGGLAGRSRAVVGTSYATGTVQGDAYVGGLLGTNDGTLSNSYATGAVTSGNYTGGLVGFSYGASLISNSYATGAVAGGGGAVGGLVGFLNAGTITASFWNTDSSGQTTSSGNGTGLTTAQMMQLASFNSWNTTTPNTIASTGSSGAIWRIYEGRTAPLLTHFLTALTLTDVVTTYNGAAQNGASGVATSLFGATQTNAGFYNGFYSNQQGYDITGGSLTINRANLTLSGTRAYDGSTAFAASGLTATGVAGESFALTGTGDASNLSSRHVQISSALTTVTGLTLGAGVNGGLSGNYNALSTAGSSISITQAALTLASADVIKTYDGNLTAAGSATVVAGGLFGLDSISGGTFAFTDKNAGDGDKTVTVTGVTVTDGNNGANYSVSYADNTTSTIDRAILTTIVTADDKIYDGNTTATATLGALIGLVGSETLSASNAATFNSRDVATANLVTVNSISLNDGSNGGLASNYTLVSGQTATAHITPRSLSVVDQVALDKVYDGTTAATLRGGSLANVIAGETVTLNEAGTFATPDAGTAISVIAANSLGGAAAANYLLTQPVGLTANITAVQTNTPPVVVVTPPVTVTPPTVGTPEPLPTATVAYTSAVGHAVSNTIVAPLPIIAALPIAAPSVGPTMAYDLGGLNLTVIEAPDAGLPAMQSRDTDEDDGL